MLNFLDKLFTTGVHKLFRLWGHEAVAGHDEVHAAHQAAHFPAQLQAAPHGSLQQLEVVSFVVVQLLPRGSVEI